MKHLTALAQSCETIRCPLRSRERGMDVSFKITTARSTISRTLARPSNKLLYKIKDSSVSPFDILPSSLAFLT